MLPGWLSAALVCGCTGTPSGSKAPPAVLVTAAAAGTLEPAQAPPARAGRRGFRRDGSGIVLGEDFLAPRERARALLELGAICAVSERVFVDPFGQTTRHYVARVAGPLEQLPTRYRRAAEKIGYRVEPLEDSGLGAHGEGLDGMLEGRMSALLAAEPDAAHVDPFIREIAEQIDLGDREGVIDLLPEGATSVGWSLEHDGRESLILIYGEGVKAPDGLLRAVQHKSEDWRLSLEPEPLRVRFERDAFGPSSPGCPPSSQRDK
jgi:hypothetical protein